MSDFMNTAEPFLESNIFNGFFWSVIVGMAITAFINQMSKPKLSIEIGQPETGQSNISRKKFREIRVEVKNIRNFKYLSWLIERRVAVGCVANVTFEDNSGHILRSIKARWIDTPLPEKREALVKQRMDIQPGFSENIVIARRYEDDRGFYPVNNESISLNADFKKTDWEIRNSEVVLKVQVSCGESVFNKTYKILHKTNKIEDFEIVNLG